jgi:hypothetical protein
VGEGAGARAGTAAERLRRHYPAALRAAPVGAHFGMPQVA